MMAGKNGLTFAIIPNAFVCSSSKRTTTTIGREGRGKEEKNNKLIILLPLLLLNKLHLSLSPHSCTQLLKKERALSLYIYAYLLTTERTLLSFFQKHFLTHTQQNENKNYVNDKLREGEEKRGRRYFGHRASRPKKGPKSYVRSVSVGSSYGHPLDRSGEQAGVSLVSLVKRKGSDNKPTRRGFLIWNQ